MSSKPPQLVRRIRQKERVFHSGEPTARPSGLFPYGRLLVPDQSEYNFALDRQHHIWRRIQMFIPIDRREFLKLGLLAASAQLASQRGWNFIPKPLPPVASAKRIL